MNPELFLDVEDELASGFTVDSWVKSGLAVDSYGGGVYDDGIPRNEVR